MNWSPSEVTLVITAAGAAIAAVIWAVRRKNGGGSRGNDTQ